jgi:prepilin-type N-terminal cleavage/methylation domain-containing protein
MELKQLGKACVRRLGGCDGFTLIETLVAFTILAMLSIVVQRSLVVTRTSLARADAKAIAERVVRTLLDAPLGERGSYAGVRSGLMDGCSWTMTTELIDLPPPPPKTKAAAGDDTAVSWRPVRVIIRAVDKTGATLKVETVRLAKLGT